MLNYIRTMEEAFIKNKRTCMLNNDNRYKYLVDARNYNFTQFNVWMAFFITINGALFIAYYNFFAKFLESNKPEELTIEKFLIQLFGYVAAFLFYCSAKGYSYWSLNSIKLLVDYEANPFRLYKGYSLLLLASIVRNLQVAQFLIYFLPDYFNEN